MADQQVESLRSAVRFLRSENALLKSRHLYPDLGLLTPIPVFTPPRSREVPQDLPPLSPSSPSAPTSDSSLPSTPVTPATRHSVDTESKLLFRDITDFQTKPRIVDISNIQHTSLWRSKKGGPETQVHSWRKEEEKLGRRLEALKGAVHCLTARKS